MVRERERTHCYTGDRVFELNFFFQKEGTIMLSGKFGLAMIWATLIFGVIMLADATGPFVWGQTPLAPSAQSNFVCSSSNPCQAVCNFIIDGQGGNNYFCCNSGTGKFCSCQMQTGKDCSILLRYGSCPVCFAFGTDLCPSAATCATGKRTAPADVNKCLGC